MLKVFLISGVLIAVGTGYLFAHFLYEVPEMPDLDLQKWWGVGSKPRNEDTSIRPFRIEFDDAMIQDLKQRLKNRRPFTKPLEGIQSEYGMNTVYLDEKLDYWLNKYDFKKRAELLNKYPHFKTRIQGLDIHFMRVTPQVSNKRVLPLLMLHGWPSSSREFHKMMPLLTTPRNGYDFVFDVIAADLPGYAFSEGTNKTGLNPVQMGIVIRNLMKRLGFDKFYLLGGDVGSQVGTHLSTLLQNEVLGFITNMPLSSMNISLVKLLLGSLAPSLFEHSERIYPLKDFFSYLMRESGYFHLQATKPDTIGVALTDSPAGLAGYLMEKFGVVTNRDQLDTPHGGLDNLDINDVLDTITIMWANSCVFTSTRTYAEGLLTKWNEVNTLHNIPTLVPTAAINFRYEVFFQPDWILRDKFPNLVRSFTHDFGGHFAAMQTPEVFADDIFEATVAFLNFHKKV